MNDKPTLGLYAGSFDPFHVGHLDIVKQAADTFQVVMIAKGINSSKIKATVATDRYVLPVTFLTTFRHDADIRVDSYDTLLVDYIKILEETYNVTLIRGLRRGADLEYEQNLVAFLRGMHPQVKVAHFMARPEYAHISSSALRDIRHFSEVEYRKYVVTD
jgi:pantetheine-phosphate adenylyltransferase